MKNNTNENIISKFANIDDKNRIIKYLKFIENFEACPNNTNNKYNLNFYTIKYKNNLTDKLKYFLTQKLKYIDKKVNIIHNKYKYITYNKITKTKNNSKENKLKILYSKIKTYYNQISDMKWNLELENKLLLSKCYKSKKYKLYNHFITENTNIIQPNYNNITDNKKILINDIINSVNKSTDILKDKRNKYLINNKKANSKIKNKPKTVINKRIQSILNKSAGPILNRYNNI